MSFMRASILLVAIAVVACASSQEPATSPAGVTNQPPASGPSSVTYAGGNGADCANAVKIVGAANSQDGVDAEYDWLRQHHPGHTVLGQALSECSGRPADILSIQTREGAKRDVYFDISEFFGKF
jgi:hypothetical protein